MRAKTFAVQLLHMPALAGKHAPHLMVAAFMQRQPGVAFAQNDEFGGQGGDVLRVEVIPT